MYNYSNNGSETENSVIKTSTLTREDVSMHGTWHVSTQNTLAREHVSTQGMLARGHISMQDMLARGHVSTQGT